MARLELLNGLNCLGHFKLSRMFPLSPSNNSRLWFLKEFLKHRSIKLEQALCLEKTNVQSIWLKQQGFSIFFFRNCQFLKTHICKIREHVWNRIVKCNFSKTGSIFKYFFDFMRRNLQYSFHFTILFLSVNHKLYIAALVWIVYCLLPL